MRRQVGEVARQFNPNKHEGSNPIQKLYGDIKGTHSKYIDVSKSLVPTLTRSGLLKLLYKQNSPFIDIRSPSDFSIFHLKRSLSIDYHDIVSGAVKPILPTNKDAEIVVIANSYRGQNAVHAMHKLGYRNTLLASINDLKEVGNKDDFGQTGH